MITFLFTEGKPSQKHTPSIANHCVRHREAAIWTEHSAFPTVSTEEVSHTPARFSACKSSSYYPRTPRTILQPFSSALSAALIFPL